MKLSELLINQAEWWITELDGKNHEEWEALYSTEASNLLVELYPSNWMFKLANPDCATLCLLEAEYQKDIEFDIELGTL